MSKPITVASSDVVNGSVVREWQCICGLEWSEVEHVRRLSITGGRWRGRASSLDPWDQWCRENLPAGHNGVVYCADDGILRTFDPTVRDDLGLWCKVEAKARLAEASSADRHTLRAVCRGRALRPLIVRYDADVPTPLRHWPVACGGCGAPGPRPEPSTVVIVEVIAGYRSPRLIKRLRPEQLRGWLLRYFGHEHAHAPVGAMRAD